ncbi:lysophospholipid acyltransferase family protein [Chloroflexota bacterium]
MNWVYYAGRWATWVLLFLLTRWKVTGRENIPTKGPLLIAANHLSLADPPIIGTSIRRKMIFFAKEDLFRAKYSSYFIRNYGALPLRRGGLNRKALASAEASLANGIALVMFPEGGRSRNLQLQDAFPGSAMLAIRLGVPILPVGISGTEVVKGLGWCWRRPRITVNIGPVFMPPEDGNKDRAALQEFTDNIMEHIAALLPPKYRGEKYLGNQP